MSIPVVDISHWSGAVEDGLVQQIHDAFTTVGFVFITGHGIPRERVSYMMSVTQIVTVNQYNLCAV